MHKLRHLGRNTAKRLMYALLNGARPVRDALRSFRRAHPVRIFTYHRLSEGHRDGMTISPAVFEQHLSYIARHHRIVSLEEAIALVSSGARLSRPHAVITFDDAYRSVFDKAFPLMERRGITGACFVATDYVGTSRRFKHDERGVPPADAAVMTWEEIKALQAAGWTIGSHSASHVRLSECDPAVVAGELQRPQETLKAQLRVERIALAYPYGGENDITPEIRKAAVQSGYTAVLSNNGGENFPPGDLSSLRRIDVGGPHPAYAWKSWVHGLAPLVPRLARSRPLRPRAQIAPPRGMLRVTHVVFDLDYGGMEEIVLALVAGLSRRAARVSVISLGRRHGPLVERLLPHVADFKVVRSVPAVSMFAPVGLARHIRQTAPDVVHLHSGLWYKGVVAARWAGTPRVIYTEHGLVPGDHWLGPWLRRRAARHTDVVVCVSDVLRNELTTALQGCRVPLVCIENGIDVERYSPGPRPARLGQELGIPEHGIVIGSIGRLESVKRYDRLLQAFRLLKSSLVNAPPLYLVIAGDGSERGRLETLAAELALSEWVRWCGWVTDPLDHYRLCDVFALTSDTEGIPLSLLEAMACGIAPVVTDVGVNRVVLGAELEGQAITRDNLHGIAAALAALVGSRDLRVSVGQRARQRVVERYSLDRMVTAYESVYRGAT